jgi:hypothetical protein
MNEGNYFRSGDHVEYKNLDSFLRDWGHDALDIEYNRIHRFDAYDYAERNLRESEFEITFYRVIQRKGFCMSQSVIVPKERESEVIEYLRPFYEQERKIWEPFTSERTEQIQKVQNEVQNALRAKS